MDKQKKLAAKLSIISNITLTALKIIAGVISGSVSIISEAIHSLSDFLASIITMFSVSKSSKPADYDHPYGHGKYEDMAGFIEGILIIVAAVFIIYKSAKKIIFGLTVEIESNLGILVMLISVFLNILTSSYLFKVAKDSNSVSLYADGEHLRTDVYSSLGIFLGLILIKITGYTILDPIIAILVATFIFRTGFTITHKTWMHLLDHSLPNEDIEKIKNIVNSYSNKVILKENSIKARQTGPSTDIDLILQFPRDTSMCECHKICDAIETEISSIFKNCSISIHPEPVCYSENCPNCKQYIKTSKI